MISHGFTWTIGDITRLDEHGLYFRIGRRSGLFLHDYDGILGVFRETSAENWPFTHVICDTRLGLLAIARNKGLTSYSHIVANRIQDAISISLGVFNTPAAVSIEVITNSDDFMKSLVGAFSIRSFAFSFTRPNPFDAEEIIQKPLERFTGAAGGTKGEVKIEGQNLSHEVIEDTARSAIASGNEVRAVIQEERRRRPIPISSREYPETIREVSIDIENPENNSSALRLIRERYAALRLG